MIIIGVSGTLGSGKDTLGDYLEGHHQFAHVSTGDLIRDLKEEALGTRVMERDDPFANNMREKFGPGFSVEKAIERYEHIKDKHPGGLVVSGLRSPGEVETLLESSGTMVFIDAPTAVRYERNHARARDKRDTISLETFKSNEISEWDAMRTDPNLINLAYAKQAADKIIINDDTLEVFHGQIERLLQTLREK